MVSKRLQSPITAGCSGRAIGPGRWLTEQNRPPGSVSGLHAAGPSLDRLAPRRGALLVEAGDRCGRQWRLLARRLPPRRVAVVPATPAAFASFAPPVPGFARPVRHRIGGGGRLAHPGNALA